MKLRYQRNLQKETGKGNDLKLRKKKILVILHCGLNDSKNVTYICIDIKPSITLYAYGSFTKQIYI